MQYGQLRIAAAGAQLRIELGFERYNCSCSVCVFKSRSAIHMFYTFRTHYRFLAVAGDQPFMGSISRVTNTGTLGLKY